MENILVSIIIPTYNVSRYIRKCLSSIQNQTYKNIEIILVDDLSDDNTVDIIEEIKISDPRIHLIKCNKNGGSAIARQIGIEHSSGELITFVDADDWYCQPDALEKIVAVYDESKADCIMYGYKTFHRHGLVRRKKFNGRFGLFSVHEAAEAKSSNPSPYWHYLWNKCFRGELLQKGFVKFTPELRRAQDVRFNADFLKCAKTYFVMKNSFFYCYNCANMNQITRKKENKSYQNSAEHFNHLEEEFLRLYNDYIQIAVSKKGIRGLYEQFYYNVIMLKYNTKGEDWHNMLYRLIESNNTYIECRRQLGKIKIKIEIKAWLNYKINKIKLKLKTIFHM